MGQLILGFDGTTPTRIQTDSAGRLYAVPGFESVVSGYATNTSAAAGYNGLVGTVVPAGKVWVITCCNAWNDTSASTRIIIGLDNGAVHLWTKSVEAPNADQQVTLEAPLILAAGSKVVADFYGCTLNDDIGLAWHGYQIEAP